MATSILYQKRGDEKIPLNFPAETISLTSDQFEATDVKAGLENLDTRLSELQEANAGDWEHYIWEDFTTETFSHLFENDAGDIYSNLVEFGTPNRTLNGNSHKTWELFTNGIRVLKDGQFSVYFMINYDGVKGMVDEKTTGCWLNVLDEADLTAGGSTAVTALYNSSLSFNNVIVKNQNYTGEPYRTILVSCTVNVKKGQVIIPRVWLQPELTIAIASLNMLICRILDPIVKAVPANYLVLTSEDTTWVDLENTTAIADAALPNPALCGGEYELTSPYGNKLVLCDILIKESGQWVYQTPQTYNAQGGTLGVTAFGPGDGKIHVCVAPNYMHFSSAEGKGSRAPNLSVSSNNSGAEIVILCHPA